MIRKVRGFSRKTLVAASIAAGVLVFATIAGASPINNGGFETGDFTGWNIANQGAGSWFVSQKIVTPLSGLGWNGPAEKEFAAVSDTTGPGSHVLYTFIKAGKNTRVEAIVYYRNRTSTFCSPADLTPTPCNQQYRIDIVDQAAIQADPFTMNPADILKTLFVTKSGSPKKLRPTEMRFKLGSISGTVALRFAEVDTQDFFNASVDNVQVNNG